MQLRLSPQAADDLERLYLDGVANFGRRQTDNYVAGLRRVFELIAANPQMARLRMEIAPPVRAHPHRSHIVIYESTDEIIVVLRIRHARENWFDETD